MSKSGWGRDSPRVCGFTLKPYCVMGVGASGSEGNAPDHHGVFELGIQWDFCGSLHRRKILRNCRRGDAPDKDWNHEEDLKGWGLGEHPLDGDALLDA